MSENRILLSNGLTISYSRFGVANGKPGFYFHGLPGSMYEGGLLHQACIVYGIDLIATDRFGYGNSSPPVGNRYLNWVECINELADHFSFERFYLLAVSGGAPYALACASQLQERVVGTSICCGLGSLAVKDLCKDMSLFAQFAIYLAMGSPLLLKLSYGVGAQLAAKYFSHRLIAILARILAERDQSALTQTKVHNILAKSLCWAFHQGSRGARDDLMAAVQNWPFELEGINNLQLWHGDNDKVVPLSHSEWLQKQIPSAQLRIIPHEGHFSLPIVHIGRIISHMIDKKKP